MGRKYASIHIPVQTDSNPLESVKKYYADMRKSQNQMQCAAGVFRDPMVKQMFERFHSLSADKKFLFVSEKFISVYDCSLSFDSVVSAAKKLSKQIFLPVLYSANFDNSLFIVGVVQAGKTICKRNIGQYLSSYGLKPQTVKINEIFSVHGFNRKHSPENSLPLFFHSDNIVECEKSLEQELDISLYIAEDELINSNDMYMLISEDMDIVVCTKNM